MVTEPIWEGNLLGIFEGYAFDRLFTLSDGSNWRQIGETREYVYREQPAARLLKEKSTGQIYLDVAGTSTIVLVQLDRSVSRWGSRAF